MTSPSSPRDGRRPLGGAAGERLELADYFADFAGRAGEFWKLEARQVFAEPGNDSWKAFARGNWEEAVRLLEPLPDLNIMGTAAFGEITSV